MDTDGQKNTTVSSLRPSYEDGLHSLCISLESGQVYFADSMLTALLKYSLYSSFEMNLAPEDRGVFLSRLRSLSRDWFSVHIDSNHGIQQLFMRLESISEGRYAHFSVLRASELINDFMRSTALSEALLSIQELYEDISFVYLPEDDIVELFTKDKRIFRQNLYSLYEFGSILMSAARDEKQSIELTHYLSHIRDCHAFFSSQLDGGLLSDALSTVLIGKTEFRKDGRTEVLGIIRSSKHAGASLSDLKRDFLTGAIQKEDITALAALRINSGRSPGTGLAIIDIDFFKDINDLYGHKRGDQVLQQVAEIIRMELGNDGLLGRIGGDEFMVLLYDVPDEARLRRVLHDIKNAIRSTLPTLGLNGDGLSVSIGCAVYPKDGASYDELFLVADYCLYLAKNKGRNRYIIYCKDKHPTLELIKSGNMSSKLPCGRDKGSYSELIVDMLYQVEYGSPRPGAGKLLSDFAMAFRPSNMLLFTGDDYRLLYESGPEILSDSKAADVLSEFLKKDYNDNLCRSFLVVNRLENLPDYMSDVKQYLASQGICSFVELRFCDASSKPAALILLSGRYIQWNQHHFRYYRLFVDILKKYDLDILHNSISRNMENTA